MSRRGSMWQLRSQRTTSSSDARIRLPQQLLEAEAGGARMRKPNHSGPEIWLACQRSVTTADGCRTGSECPMISAPGLVYIVGGDSRNSDEC
jgi:hypothetical protein